jgi:D-alanyl-D-alanine carboxypeptidase/D-alanyl-D-alanine-endopeptidase (penicillin-binding protein 4)
MVVRPPKRRRAIVRRRLRPGALAFIVFAVIVAAVLGIHGLDHGRPVARATPTPRQGPSFASAFVRTGAPWSSGDVRHLVRIAAPVVNGGAFPDTTGAIFVAARTGRILYEHNAHMTLVPASTMKLIVAATALRDLGPGYRFETDVVTNGSIGDGALRGDVYLVGGGDPELSSNDLRTAIGVLKREGLTSVEGGVIADGTLYGPDAVNKAWDPDDLEYGWAAPPSAVSIDNGAVQFTIVPDPGGGLASIAIDPPSAAGRIVGNVRTVSADGDNTLRIDPLPDGTGFAVSGQIPYGAPQKYWRSIAHPTDVAATVLRALAVGGGLQVSGAASSGKAPSGATTVAWSHRSRPLAQIVRHMAFDSDNHIAEQLLRAVGAQRFGSGTLDDGVEAEHEFLASLNAADDRMVISDGSGLSAANRISVSTLAAVLRSMLSGPDARAEATLWPRVGVEGTVRYRQLPPDVIGRVRGKDGYIEGASGLAGYVQTAHHGVIVYAFLVDGWAQGLDAIWNGEDDVLARLARM